MPQSTSLRRVLDGSAHQGLISRYLAAADMRSTVVALKYRLYGAIWCPSA